MTNWKQKGDTVTTVAPTGGVTSGQALQVGLLFGIVSYSALAGATIELETMGIVVLPKDTASTFGDGSIVYWDNVNKFCTGVAGSHLEIGIACLTNPDGTSDLGGTASDATVTVRLKQQVSGPGLKVAHFLYSFAVDGGASCTPSISDTIPASAVVFGGSINPTTALTAAGAATLSVGTTAGSSAASILAVTGKASLSLDAVVVPTCVATPFKMTAAGQISIAVATGPLTAGVVEGWVVYVPASAA